jgi:nitroreductase
MDVMEAIKTRRSIGKVKPDPVEIEKIELILEAGTWAPNHLHTEPWEFFVLRGEGRRPLGRTLAEIAKEGMDDPTTEENQIKLALQENKPFRAPVIIAVAVNPKLDNPRVLEIEEIGAVNAAIQNMLLMAHELELSTVWRTGQPTYHPKMRELFKLQPKGQILGFIYVGYAAMEQPKAVRVNYLEKTTWIDSDIETADSDK